jgi:hypothetical protein
MPGTIQSLLGTGNSDGSGRLTREALVQLLIRAGSGRTLGVRRAAGSSEMWGSREERHYQYSPHQEPQPEGLTLLRGGEFGNPEITKQPLQKTLRETKLRLDRPVKGEVFKVLITTLSMIQDLTAPLTGPRA